MGGIKSNEMNDFIIYALKYNDPGHKVKYRKKQIKLSKWRSEWQQDKAHA